MTHLSTIKATPSPSYLAYGTTVDELGQGAPSKLLLASILHELHQPLVAIRLCAESGLANCGGEGFSAEKVSTLFEAAGESVEMAMRMIGRLCDLVEGQAPAISPTDVNQAVQAVLRLTEIVARSRGVSIVNALEPDLECIWADRGALQQAVLNLVFNAIEAIDEQGERRVSVCTRRSGDAIAIVVADTGCGIAEEHRERLFEPKFTTKPEGNGLGLGIAREIIIQHGGSLSLLRSKVGEGTCFCVRLPTSLSASEGAQIEVLPYTEERPADDSKQQVSDCLSSLDHHIAWVEQRIAEQEMIIECNQIMGRPVTESERLLSTMNEMLLIWQTQHALLIENLSHCSSAGIASGGNRVLGP